MEIRAASLMQVQQSKNGQMVAVDDDVLDVARRLREVNDSLRLRWSEAGEYFVVYELHEDGNEYLVLTSEDLNPQIIERVQQISNSSYDYAKELDALDAARDRELDRITHEKAGEVGERIFHAIGKDTGQKTKIFVPHSFDVGDR
jgi:hypothetical protein